MPDAMTPEQMRALAQRESEESARYIEDDVAEDRYFEMQEVVTALRAAADQIEAVRNWNWRHEGLFVNQDVEAILTADTAPQESGYCHCGTARESHAIEEHAYVDMGVPPQEAQL